MFIEEFSIEEKLLEIFQKVAIYFEEPEFYDLPLQLNSITICRSYRVGKKHL